MNGELRWLRKEAVVVYFKTLSWGDEVNFENAQLLESAAQCIPNANKIGVRYR